MMENMNSTIRLLKKGIEAGKKQKFNNDCRLQVRRNDIVRSTLEAFGKLRAKPLICADTLYTEFAVCA